MKLIRARDLREGDIIRNGKWLDRVSGVHEAPGLRENGDRMLWIHCNDDTYSTCIPAFEWVEVARD